MLRLWATLGQGQGKRPGTEFRPLEFVQEGRALTCRTSWLDLAVELDRAYRISAHPTGIVIHDGRATETPEQPCKLNGSFLSVALADRGGQPGLAITTDKLGTVPIYVRGSSDEMFISTQLTSNVLRHGASPDPLGLWDLVLFDVPLWDRSLLGGVKLLPPASTISLFAGHDPDIERYWSPPDPHERAALAGDETLIDELIEHLAVAHARANCGAPVAYPVTGGLDSRINLALHRGDLDAAVLFHAFAQGEPEGPIAERIARILGKPLLQIPIIEAMLALPHADPAAETGELNGNQWWLGTVGQRLTARTAAVSILDGYLQDILFNPHLVGPEESPNRGDVSVRSAAYRYRLLGKDPGDAFFQELKTRFLDNYHADALTPLQRSQRFYLENRSRKLVFGSVRLTQNHLPVSTPGIDNDLLAFGFSLPWELRKGGPIYRGAVVRLAPDLGNAVYDKTGLPLTSRRKMALRLRARRTAHRYLDIFWRHRPFLRNSECNLDEVMGRRPDFLAEIHRMLTGSTWVLDMLGSRREASQLFDRERRERRLGSLLGSLVTIAKLETVVARQGVHRCRFVADTKD